MSGWQDGYKNPVDHVLRGLGERGKPVAAMLGPWGHRYPFDGYPGPRVDWLRYVVDHWWDRWLKGSQPDPKTQWPELTVWMGQSREPSSLPDYDDNGKWVAEDHNWMSRTKSQTLFLGPEHELAWKAVDLDSQKPSDSAALTVAGTPLTMGTSMLETSSFGAAGNGDLPGDQSTDDHQSIYFDSAPLAEDLECFGYPMAKLNVECDKPIASLVIRLTEVSPDSGQSHLVSYTFFNLAYRDGDQAHPKPVQPGIFTVSVPLNIMGHVFKRGWKIRMAVSPFYFPTLWQAPQVPTVKIYTGHVDGRPDSTLVLPGRPPRAEDAGMPALLPRRTAYVNPEQYAPTVKSLREGSKERHVERVVVDGRPGTLVRKVFDSGSTVVGGILDNLEVDVTAQENFRILDGDPLSDTGFTHYETSLVRGDWKVKTVTDTRVWSESTPEGPVFRYEADIHSFIGDQPFEDAHVQGAIPRLWV
jgi:predicted acyl esterase